MNFHITITVSLLKRYQRLDSVFFFVIYILITANTESTHIGDVDVII